MRALALLACAHTAAAGEYVHSETYMGEDFFSKWVFWNAPDASKGAVEYLDYASALANGLVNATPSRVYLGSDGKAYDGGRRAVRIQSVKTYNAGLFIVKVDHVPTGCGTWPAFWLYGEDAEHVWPQWGEYDIIEGVHVMSRVMTTLHTTSHCDQSSVQKGRDFSSEWLPGADSGDADSCNVNAGDQWFNQGCSQSGPPASLGPEFNAWGGGTFAAEWDPSGMHIRTWFWPAGNEPLDVAAHTPDPDAWGMPYSYFTLRPDICPANHFANMRIVFSLTFCGDLGDPTFADICPEYAQEMTCRELVTGHPDAFREAFWSIRSLDVYQKDQDSAVPLPASAVTPVTRTTSNGAQKYWLAAAGGFAAAAALMAMTAAVLFRKTRRTGAQAGMLWEESHI